MAAPSLLRALPLLRHRHIVAGILTPLHRLACLSATETTDQFSRAKYLYGAENPNLHSGRYMDGERLNAEDEKIVVAKLLAYHPRSNCCNYFRM